MRRSLLQLAAVLALTVGLALASPALAAQDELSGGTVTLEPTSSKALKLKPGSLSLSITSGAVDPVGGEGTVKAAGTLRVKAGKRKAKVEISGFSFGANGGPGTIAAKVGKKRVKGFGALSGGTVVRDGFGAQISGVAASLSASGVKALNGALKSGTKSKGGTRAVRAGKIKAGQPLGSLSATTIPKTVEVLPGGSMTLHTDPNLVTKFLAHCVNALPGAGGVYPIAPATQDPVSAAFTFPVTGGAVAPSLAEGKVITGGGQGLAKNMGAGPPYPCDQDPPVGTAVLQTQLTTDFASSHLVGVAQLPTATQNASIAVIDFSTGTKSFDPATKQVTVVGATVTLDRLSAILLNQLFPNRSSDPSNDFSDKDVLGTLDLTATLR